MQYSFMVKERKQLNEGKNMKYEYYIKNEKTGLYYNGNAYGDRIDWTENKSFADSAFGYSEKGAHQKIADFPAMFAGCIVERA